METIVLALHIIVCLLLIVIVLLQSGKEGMGVIFGGGSSSLFGSSGAGGLLVKVTAVAAAIFLTTSLGSNYLAKTRLATGESSVMEGIAPEAPAVPGNGSEPAAEEATPSLLLEEKGDAPDFSLKDNAEADTPADTSPEAADNKTQ